MTKGQNKAEIIDVKALEREEDFLRSAVEAFARLQALRLLCLEQGPTGLNHHNPRHPSEGACEEIHNKPKRSGFRFAVCRHASLRWHDEFWSQTD